MDILKRLEQSPASYPAAPSGLSTEAAALDSDMIWSRIEAYTAHRFTVRTVTWTVTGPGSFEPDLTPATITTSEIWDGTGYIPASLDASFMGGAVLGHEGPYRITATVGAGPVPAAVSEAYRRLAEYLAADPGGVVGASSYSVGIGQLTETIRRDPAFIAKAMQMSGAGDLLRPFRRA